MMPVPVGYRICGAGGSSKGMKTIPFHPVSGNIENFYLPLPLFQILFQILDFMKGPIKTDIEYQCG